MEKIKITKKINNYISLEYEKNNLDIFHIWYTGKIHAYDCLYDNIEKKFFAFSTLHSFLTYSQKEKIIKEIKKIQEA